jgi:putative oxidoreductase
MKRWLNRYQNWAYALIRLISGLMFFCHGAQKLFGFPGTRGPVHEPLMVAAGIIEFAGGLAIALGLRTREVAFLACGEMAVAYFKAHAPRGFLPPLNGGELAVLYTFLFLYFVTRGSGTWSVDHLLERWFGKRQSA